jgi:hypothetical protein
VITQISDLVQAAPGYLERAQRGNGVLAQLDTQFHLIDQLKRLGAQVPPTAFAVARSFTMLVFVVVTGFILTAYIAVSLPELRGGLPASWPASDGRTSSRSSNSPPSGSVAT